jgi:hypothetical protein
MRIGETVFGTIGVGTRASAIVVPLEALVPEADQFHVFVVDANGIAHERDVKIGGRTSTSAEIVEGLTVGERIVTFGAYAVEDNAKILPMNAAGDTAASETPEKAPEKGAEKAAPPAAKGATKRDSSAKSKKS